MYGPSQSKLNEGILSMEMLRKQTHFSKEEIERLSEIFKKLIYANQEESGGGRISLRTTPFSTSSSGYRPKKTTISKQLATKKSPSSLISTVPATQPTITLATGTTSVYSTTESAAPSASATSAGREMASDTTTTVNLPRVSGGDTMDRLTFKEFLYDTFGIRSEDALLDRIYNAFDKRSDGVVHLDEWIIGLSVFLRGTLDERVAFAFYVYDLNSDGVVTKDEIFTLLKNSLLKLPHDEDPDESVKELVEMTLKKLDCDKDGKISFDDFRQAVREDNLLVQALGQCLPDDQYDETPLQTLLLPFDNVRR